MKIGYYVESLSDFFSDYRKKSGNIVVKLEKKVQVSSFLRNSGIYNIDNLCQHRQCRECSQVLLYNSLYSDSSLDYETKPVMISGNLGKQLKLDDFSLKIAVNHYLYSLTAMVDFPVTAYVCGSNGKIFYDHKESATKVTRKNLIDIFSDLHKYQYTLDSVEPEFYQSDDIVHRLPYEIGINIDGVRTTGYIVLPRSDDIYIKEEKEDYFILDLDSEEKIENFRRLRLLGLVDPNINTSINVVISALFLYRTKRLRDEISSFFMSEFLDETRNDIFSMLNDVKIKYVI